MIDVTTTGVTARIAVDVADMTAPGTGVVVVAVAAVAVAAAVARASLDTATGGKNLRRFSKSPGRWAFSSDSGRERWAFGSSLPPSLIFSHMLS
jgi:hypothetical protein